MIWRFPNGVDAGVVNDDLVEPVDTFPTVCDLAGLSTPDTVQGRSLTDALTGGAIEREAVFCETPNYRTVRTSEYKLTR
jgi:iduronate 2-sulfatase